jgi:hypothetical protein
MNSQPNWKSWCHCKHILVICWAILVNAPGALSLSAVLDTARVLRMQQNKQSKRPHVSFSHVHLYVDHLKDLQVYKDLEDRLTGFVKDCKSPLGQDIVTQQDNWRKVQPDHFAPVDEAAFVPQNRDLAQQLLAGFGFRVTGARYGAANTRTVLVTSKDPSGVQFLLTAKDAQANGQQDTYRHFDAGKYGMECPSPIG